MGDHPARRAGPRQQAAAVVVPQAGQRGGIEPRHALGEGQAGPPRSFVHGVFHQAHLARPGNLRMTGQDLLGQRGARARHAEHEQGLRACRGGGAGGVGGGKGVGEGRRQTAVVLQHPLVVVGVLARLDGLSDVQVLERPRVLAGPFVHAGQREGQRRPQAVVQPGFAIQGAQGLQFRLAQGLAFELRELVVGIGIARRGSQRAAEGRGRALLVTALLEQHAQAVPGGGVAGCLGHLLAQQVLCCLYLAEFLQRGRQAQACI
ncbi:MAG TPA: hypothetical protein PLF63_09125, partial [Rubrivivax sp.]|nr:hypothetical protein [Rubrivivax sp.]